MLSLQPQALTAFLQEQPHAQLLDVREAWELQLCQIRVPGVQNLDIPMHLVPTRLQDIASEQPVVCICHHGARSAQVVAFLERQGYTQVYNLSGGIDAWSTTVDAGVPRY